MLVSGPLLVVVILSLSLGSHELQGLMIRVDDCFFSKDVMLPLAEGLDN